MISINLQYLCMQRYLQYLCWLQNMRAARQKNTFHYNKDSTNSPHGAKNFIYTAQYTHPSHKWIPVRHAPQCMMHSVHARFIHLSLALKGGRIGDLDAHRSNSVGDGRSLSILYRRIYHRADTMGGPGAGGWRAPSRITRVTRNLSTAEYRP